jgi:hypothetical protein
MAYAEVCAAAAVVLALRGPHGAHAAQLVSHAAGALRDIAAQLRPLAFDETIIEAERSRAAEEALKAAGLAPLPRPGHLRAVP